MKRYLENWGSESSYMIFETPRFAFKEQTKTGYIKLCHRVKLKNVREESERDPQENEELDCFSGRKALLKQTRRKIENSSLALCKWSAEPKGGNRPSLPQILTGLYYCDHLAQFAPLRGPRGVPRLAVIRLVTSARSRDMNNIIIFIAVINDQHSLLWLLLYWPHKLTPSF
ncbi:hypothetical protein RRG08_025579 [Elysia crispata]|uniref:Uncharacterized protein n=1 Tax=Elysia crispata TaxID=231223 RepID=A0AAE0YE23_9GAST|nr:hypothetical protein RRG08_025579 [Elysia crispata]